MAYIFHRINHRKLFLVNQGSEKKEILFLMHFFICDYILPPKIHPVVLRHRDLLRQRPLFVLSYNEALLFKFLL